MTSAVSQTEAQLLNYTKMQLQQAVKALESEKEIKLKLVYMARDLHQQLRLKNDEEGKPTVIRVESATQTDEL